jgi:RNA recognition motif-containing protein
MRYFRRRPHNRVGGISYASMKILEKVKLRMEAKLYVGNLSKSATQDELETLFAQAGEVTSAEVIKDRKSGESRGFAFVTMSAQSEADKAVSMFNSYSLSDHTLKVSLAKPREQRGVTSPVYEP